MRRFAIILVILAFAIDPTPAGYTNFEVSHVHPIALTPSGNRLLVVNTPDAMLEVFAVMPDGGLVAERSIPVGLEPVSVVVRSETEAWVVSQLSDGITRVDPGLDFAIGSLHVGDEPTDVAFAGGRVFVTVGGENAVKVYDPADLDVPPVTLELFSIKPRALAVSPDGSRVYAVPLFSGNRTTVVNASVIAGIDLQFDPARLAALDLSSIDCDGAPPPYPPLPPGIQRNASLVDPPAGVAPPVALIVGWNDATSRWEDDAGQDWTHCLPYRLPDHDLFVIDTGTLAVQNVDHLGTILFDVSVNPADGKIWLPHTEARNRVRFEHPLGLRGHFVDNRLSVIDPSEAFAVSTIDLNAHIDRQSDPATNLAERAASVSQPGMMAWNAAGTRAWMTAIGSRRLFRIDGACSSGNCIFGEDRAAPDSVEVGEGPTGVVYHEGRGRLYVLLRFSNSVAIVDAVGMTRLAEVPLHDPSPPVVRDGRRIMYDAIDGSGHGDAACSSCHVSGDRDGLAWDLGDPEGEMVPYSNLEDNVRFVVPLAGQLFDCSPGLCASHAGFDPQKGPMTTQTFRGMLEPLHWRGDRPTFNAFNMAFVSLMGRPDIGPIQGQPAGVSETEMERFRQFALGIAFPPNPLRELDDGLPDRQVPVAGTPFSGNPSNGAVLFDTFPADANSPCATCHTRPFGAGGGKLGGVTPVEPVSPDAAALFNGDADKSPHSDLKIPHLRNMYEKPGVRFGPSASQPLDARSGFGYTHDGAVPDLGTFLSLDVFDLNAAQTRDVAAFMTHFPTGTKPAVGAEITLPPGVLTGELDPTLVTLMAVGDHSDAARHCELTASTLLNGARRHLRYEGGTWLPDAAGGAALSTGELFESASAPVHLLCVPIGSGLRVGGDRDEDDVLNADDCAPAAPGSFAMTFEVSGLTVELTQGASLAWDPQDEVTGPDVRYEVLGGELADLSGADPFGSSSSLSAGLVDPRYTDARIGPDAGVGRFYLVRAENACGVGTLGEGRDPFRRGVPLP